MSNTCIHMRASTAELSTRAEPTPHAATAVERDASNFRATLFTIHTDTNDVTYNTHSHNQYHVRSSPDVCRDNYFPKSSIYGLRHDRRIHPVRQRAKRT